MLLCFGVFVQQEKDEGAREIEWRVVSLAFVFEGEIEKFVGLAGCCRITCSFIHYSLCIFNHLVFIVFILVSLFKLVHIRNRCLD